jgi:sigma-B regulation protein RsbU (phosphoserine phosphatase)
VAAPDRRVVATTDVLLEGRHFRRDWSTAYDVGRKQLDHQVHVVNKQNEELRQFNRVVTHDLQEPLRKLSIFTNLLRNQEGEEEKKTLDKLASLYEKMHAIVSGLQQYVWLTETSMKPRKLPLNELLQASRTKLEKEHPEVSLKVEAEDLGSVEADEAQLLMLFYQILSNAIRFRKPGNNAIIRVNGSAVSRNQFRNIRDKYKYSDYLKVRFADEGIGFDSVFKDQTFELFKRLHPESGRGIGLSLAKKIMDNHNGEIDIDSRKGEGTTVTLLFPLIQPDPSAKENYVHPMK